MKHKYKYYIPLWVYNSIKFKNSGIPSIWRHNKETNEWQISFDRPTNWSLSTCADCFSAEERVTKKEARRYFPHATIE